MDWMQFAIMVVAFVGLFIWNRTESRADSRHMDTKLESNRSLSLQIHKDTEAKLGQMHKDTEVKLAQMSRELRELAISFHREIQQEMKDFHGRLCAIEERRK